MALAALIAAYHELAEPGALRSTLPLAGRTVVERQARLAAAAGASPVVVLVERMPPVLTAALDRLRRDRVPVEVARGIREAAIAVGGADRLLLIGDGAVADRGQLGRIVQAPDAAVLTVPDSGHGELYERIDGATRWAGIAIVDGALLGETAEMIEDWDAQSTLLRRAIQAGARHLAADGPIAILDAPGEVSVLERRILASVRERRGGWASRLLAPVENALTALLMSGPIGASLVGGLAVALTAGGAGAFAWGWLRTGLALVLVATALDGAATRLARLRMQDDPGRGWWNYLMPVLAGGALLALGYALEPAWGWGMILLAVVTLCFMIAQGIELDGRSVRFSLVLADRKNLCWAMLPFAIFDAWHIGIAFSFTYAAGSFFAAQAQVHAEPPAQED